MAFVPSPVLSARRPMPTRTALGCASSSRHAIPSPSSRRARSNTRRTIRCDTPEAAANAGSAKMPPVSFVTEDPTTHITKLQDALDNAVASEQYVSAAAIRDELRIATNEDSVLILSALLNYYDAFSSQSVSRIRRQWHDCPDVICQHPLTSPHIGYHNVIAGYRTLFETLPSDLKFAVSDVRIASYGIAAFVTCIELPESESLALSLATEGARAKWHGLLATSIFEKVWDHTRQQFNYLLVHHVSSPIFLTEDSLSL